MVVDLPGVFVFFAMKIRLWVRETERGGAGEGGRGEAGGVEGKMSWLSDFAGLLKLGRCPNRT